MSGRVGNLLKKYRELPLPVKAGFCFTAANFLQRGLTMITTPIFTRLLSQEQYGISSTYSAWHNVLVLLVTLSLYKGMNNLFKDDEGYDKVTSSVSSLSIVVSAAWVILGIIFSKPLSSVFGMSQTLTVGLCLSFIPQAIINCWSVRKRYEYAYKPVIIEALVTVVGGTFIGAILVVCVAPTAEAKTMPTIIVTLIVSIVLYASMMKKDNTFYDKKIWTFSLSFCVTLLPHYLSEFVLQSSDKLMINAMCGSVDVAVYSIAYSVGSLITLMTSALNNTVIPYRYQRLKDQNYKQLAKVSNETLLLVAAGLMAIMLMAPEIIYIFGGEQYNDAKYLVIPICIGVYFNYVFQLFSTVQEYYERKKTVVFASISCALLNLILNYIFIKLCGYQAAAYTTFFCYMLFSFVHYLFYRKVCREELGGVQIYDIKGVFGISLGVIIGGLIISQIVAHTIIKYCVLVIIVVIAVILLRKRMRR